MPELPEVEVTRRGLLASLPGRRIVAVACSGYRLRSELPRAPLQRHIAGQTIATIDRRAKYLLFRMESGAVLLAHLGMTGKFAVVPVETPPHRHDHLRLGLDDGSEVRYNDSRRFGMIAVWPEAEAAAFEEEFSRGEGVEPLGPDFTADRLLRLAQGRGTPVKALLMNARLIAGIGNIYANETLFAAGIHPLTPAGDLSRNDWQRIVPIAIEILQRAIEAGGSTIADFLGASGNPGYFQLQLNAYGRKGLPCIHCGRAIEKTELAGRATYHCPACQPAPRARRPGQRPR